MKQSEEVRGAIEAILCRTPGVIGASYFGSIAAAECDSLSDIDLVVGCAGRSANLVITALHAELEIVLFRPFSEDRQLALYQLALSDRYAEEETIRLVWHFLQSGETRVSQRSRGQLEELRRATMSLIDRIRETTEFPTHRTRLCDWCEYKARCFASEP